MSDDSEKLADAKRRWIFDLTSYQAPSSYGRSLGMGIGWRERQRHERLSCLYVQSLPFLNNTSPLLEHFELGLTSFDDLVKVGIISLVFLFGLLWRLSTFLEWSFLRIWFCIVRSFSVCRVREGRERKFCWPWWALHSAAQHGTDRVSYHRGNGAWFAKVTGHRLLLLLVLLFLTFLPFGLRLI